MPEELLISTHLANNLESNFMRITLAGKEIFSCNPRQILMTALTKRGRYTVSITIMKTWCGFFTTWAIYWKFIIQCFVHFWIKVFSSPNTCTAFSYARQSVGEKKTGKRGEKRENDATGNMTNLLLMQTYQMLRFWTSFDSSQFEENSNACNHLVFESEWKGMG